MTRDEIILDLRHRISDEQAVEFSNDNLLGYLDMAAKSYGEQLIVSKNPVLKKRLTLLGYTPVPDDFVSLVGDIPIVIADGHMEYYEDFVPLEVFYWSKIRLPSTYAASEQIELPRDMCLTLASIAAMLALNRNEFDITQDANILEKLLDNESRAKGGM